MTNRKPPMRGAAAGMTGLGAMLACILIGAAVGAAAGSVGLGVAGGACVGIFAGIWVVYKRFSDL